MCVWVLVDRLTDEGHFCTQQDDPLIYAYGMMWTLIVGTIWLAVSTYYAWNVSSTHSIIGACLLTRIRLSLCVSCVHQLPYRCDVRFPISSQTLSDTHDAHIAIILVFTYAHIHSNRRHHRLRLGVQGLSRRELDDVRPHYVPSLQRYKYNRIYGCHSLHGLD